MDHPELLQAYKSKRNRINIIHIVASVIIAVLLVLMAASSAKADTYDELVARYQNQTTEVGIMPGSEVEYHVPGSYDVFAVLVYLQPVSELRQFVLIKQQCIFCCSNHPHICFQNLRAEVFDKHERNEMRKTIFGGLLNYRVHPLE